MATVCGVKELLGAVRVSTCFFDMFVDIIGSSRGVWDVIVCDKVDLRKTMRM